MTPFEHETAGGAREPAGEAAAEAEGVGAPLRLGEAPVDSDGVGEAEGGALELDEGDVVAGTLADADAV